MSATNEGLAAMPGGRRELRVALTDRCNFRCFFCHAEGLELDRRTGQGEGTAADPDRDDGARWMELLEEAMGLGYDDLTFTGGEPLLRAPLLEELLGSLAALPKRPDVTVVTNGVLLSQKDIIGTLQAYPGRLKLHVSLHATDAKTFKAVTGAGLGAFEEVKNGIRKATAAGLRVKVNHVVLRGHSHQGDQLVGAVEQARELGASAIKFLELLVFKDNAELFGAYYQAAAVARELERRMVGLLHEPSPTLRRKVYRPRGEGGFAIEVQQLTCQLGCANCHASRDRTLSHDRSYYPCFVRTKGFRPVAPGGVEAAFAWGNAVIDGLAERHGTSSPTMLRVEEHVAAKREVFFEVDDPAEMEKFLAARGYHLQGKEMFREAYYRPVVGDPAWQAWEKVLMVAVDSHDQTKVEVIYTDRTYVLVSLGDGQPDALEVETKFLYEDGPLVFETRERADRLLTRLGFGVDPGLELEWDLAIYGARDDGQAELSLSLAPCATLKLRGTPEQIRDAYAALAGCRGLRPLGIPLLAHVLECRSRAGAP